MTKRDLLALSGLLLLSAVGCADTGAPSEDTGPDLAARASLPEAAEQSTDDIGSTSQSLTVTNCNSGEMYHMGLVWGQARQVAERGASVFALDPNHYDVQMWFGWPTSSHIGSVLRGVRDDLISENVHVICDNGHASCTGMTARAQGYNDVRLCSAFWGLPYWQQVGVFLHELSHLNGAPLDACYGPEACYDLARVDPATARRTGASYEEYYYSVW